MDCNGQQAPGDFGAQKDGTRGRNVVKPVHDVVPVAFSTQYFVFFVTTFLFQHSGVGIG
jgi:hypothetical protein